MDATVDLYDYLRSTLVSADQLGRVRTLVVVFLERTDDMSAAHPGPRLLRHRLLDRSIFGVGLVGSPAS